MSTQSPEEREALQREIQAAIAAGREVDPTMDEHLAASAAARIAEEQKVRDRIRGVQQARQAAQPGQPNPNLELVVRSLGTVVIIAAVITAIIFQPHLIFSFWWLIFLIGPVWGWRGRRWSSRRNYYARAYPAQPELDEDDLRRQRDDERQRKIAKLEAEIKQLKHDDYV
jgi:hypothetical protein